MSDGIEVGQESGVISGPDPDDSRRLPDPLEARLVAIEARQRLYGQHDPSCSHARAMLHNRRGGTYQSPGTCGCWLAKDGSEPKA